MKEFLIVIFIFFLIGVCEDVYNLSDGDYPRKVQVSWKMDIVNLTIRGLILCWISYLLVWKWNLLLN